jgi:transcriptional regulator with XRE-family HTH domain
MGDRAGHEKIGDSIAAARRHKGLTGGRLGELIGLGKDQVSKIESGRRGVDGTELVRLAAALDVTFEYLLGLPERPCTCGGSGLPEEKNGRPR